MNARDNLIAYARTFVPVIAGVILTALAGIDIEVDSGALETVLQGLVTGVASLLYYGSVRAVALATKQPKLEALNGFPKKPSYEPALAV